MPHRRLPLYLLAATACAGILAGPAGAQSPAVSADAELVYQVATLGISGSATCDGGGTAGVEVVDGSLEQMFQGGIGGPIAIRLDGPVQVDCDGAAHRWTGNLVAPGRILPNSSGGQVTVNLTRGQSTIATTGPQPAYIVG
ncbi:hypothetical protein [Nocardia sp. NPDC057668]|uniref:hypothetical protein n=1 Tax=Nocardia sp. NPDC057668 TaxID=3346202 RepID=UPI0036703990